MLAAPAIAPRSLIDRWHQRCFDAVYQRSLLYNACWEDPAIDRVALNLGADDVVMVITSGGCNALDYLLAGVAGVHAVISLPCLVMDITRNFADFTSSICGVLCRHSRKHFGTSVSIGFQAPAGEIVFISKDYQV